ncbi:hypothetical protein FOMPIDRAFT_1017592 [Fomitopsis schrenkii]|uniref:Uncharacterized protein n=1 Tax=Fomitopsis schrenkii TaxID=2126942 RepID=S8E0P1_FOMSC|nr:hypothetical protein FOMPIDRAFT_1017592 [Fomitopsis schrenkii]
MALRIADRTWAGFVSELVHLAADHPDCEDRLDVLFTDSPPTSFAENSAALSGITNLLKEVWEGPLDDAAAFKLISEFILPAEWAKAFDDLPADAAPAIVRALKIYRAEVRVMNMRTVKHDVPFMPLAIEEGCTARNDVPDGQSLVTDHLSVAWISNDWCISFTYQNRPAYGKPAPRKKTPQGQAERSEQSGEGQQRPEVSANDEASPPKKNGKRAAPASESEEVEDHDDRDDELDELDPEEDEAVQRTTTRKGKGKKSASTAPPKKKARVAPAATTPPRPAAAKAVRATPARATCAVTVAARNKVVMPVRATRGKATGKGARKQSTAKTLQTLLVKFRGKFRCAGCSRRDGSNNEVPECRVVGQAWRCFECNDGHRNCEISVRTYFAQGIIYVKAFVIIDKKTRLGVYELYDGSNAYSEALEAAGMSGLKVHVTQGLAIERLTKEVKNLKKMVKATLGSEDANNKLLKVRVGLLGEQPVELALLVCELGELRAVGTDAGEGGRGMGRAALTASRPASPHVERMSMSETEGGVQHRGVLDGTQDGLDRLLQVPGHYVIGLDAIGIPK